MISILQHLTFGSLLTIQLTMSESVNKGEASYIQRNVVEFIVQAHANRFQLNQTKCKELRIGFGQNPPQFDSILIYKDPVEVVAHAKILGLYISNNLKSNKTH